MSCKSVSLANFLVPVDGAEPVKHERNAYLSCRVWLLPRMAHLEGLGCVWVQVVGVLVGIALVDIAGRRPLLIWGSAGCAASMVLLFAADMLHSIPFEVSRPKFKPNNRRPWT